ncbi:MAG: hypothetical protein JW800_08390 [Candidatus Omnitrophica bacterium]|nr:hypothetical protein [Candidatus Omnitrophota bacterium]
MLKNISKREKILAGLTIGVAVVALSYTLIIEPLVSRWRKLEEDIRDKEVLLVKHSKIIRDKGKLENIHKEYAKYFQGGSLTKEEESALALSNIEEIARRTNTYITNIKPLTAKDFDNYSKLTFRVTIECDISSLTKFIYDLQSSEQLMKIDSVVLRAKEKSPDIIKAVMNVSKISVY